MATTTIGPAVELSEPIRRAAVLTPRGDAAVMLHRFVRQLRALDATDRAWILDALREELGELPVTR